MGKKHFLVLFSIIIIIVGFSLFIINDSYTNINLGGTHFKPIDGYKHVKKDNYINFTNDKNFIFIKTSNSTINSSISSYLKSKGNVSYQLSNFSVDGLNVYKLVLKNYTIGHFWFEKNNKVYEIYTWNYDEPTNVDIMNLIKSAN